MSITTSLGIWAVYSGGFLDAKKSEISGQTALLKVEKLNLETDIEKFTNEKSTLEKHLSDLKAKTDSYEKDTSALQFLTKLFLDDEEVARKFYFEIRSESNTLERNLTITSKEKNLPPIVIQKNNTPIDICRHIVNLKDLSSITIAGVKLNSLDLRLIVGKSFLQYLNLQNCGLSDPDLIYCKGNYSITSVCLKKNNFKKFDGQVQFNNISLLDISENPIDDSWINLLQGSRKKLLTLDLSGTEITDASADFIAKNLNPNFVFIKNTKISVSGIAILVKSMGLDKKRKLLVIDQEKLTPEIKKISTLGLDIEGLHISSVPLSFFNIQP